MLDIKHVDSIVQNLALAEILEKPENHFCADCHTKSPKWASTAFGIFICIRCSGFHRKFGTHITKVRSVNFDKWTAELLDFYKHMSTL